MKIRARTVTKLPASLQARGGLKVEKEHGRWTFSPDWSVLALETTIHDPSQRHVWTLNPNTGTYTRVSLKYLIDSLNIEGMETVHAAAIATAADRVQTGADRAQTGEDRDDVTALAAQVASDAEATAADRVQTGEDRSAVAADRTQTGADRAAVSADAAQVAADRVATAADRVQTGQDRVAVNADRIQTGQDRVAVATDAAQVAADRVQTGLDRATATEQAGIATAQATIAAQKAAATAADRTQTGLDRVAVSADREQVSLDAAATAADRVATGADRIAVASDRNQVSLDAASAAASAAAAAANSENPAFSYKWSTGTAAADPGETYVATNAASFEDVTELYLSDTALEGPVGSFIVAMTSSTSPIKAVIVLSKPLDPTQWVALDVLERTDHDGYRALTVTVIGSHGQFATDDELALYITRTGDKGTDGTGIGDVIGPEASVPGEIALFEDATGKRLSRATVTGLLKAADGVLAQAVAGTDYVTPAGLGSAIAPKANAADVTAALAEKADTTDVGTALATKVDKIAGKQLSTEDYSTAEKTKLAGIAAGATANSTDADLLDRENHTGEQAIGTVTGLQTALDGKAGLSGNNTFSGAQAFTNWITLQRALEVVEQIATAPDGAMQFDVVSGGVKYYSTAATGNFSLNLRVDADTTLASAVPDNRTLTVVAMIENGATAHWLTALTIDGGAPDSIRWANGMAPTAGNASAIDTYTFTIHRRSGGRIVVLASLTPYSVG